MEIGIIYNTFLEYKKMKRQFFALIFSKYFQV